MEDVNENQQSSYSQCECVMDRCGLLFQSPQHPFSKHHEQLFQLFLSPLDPVSGWFIPGTGSLYPPANPHSQFGSPLSLSSSHGCERYSTLRNHRSTPYSTSPYSHRTGSPSECPPSGPTSLLGPTPLFPPGY